MSIRPGMLVTRQSYNHDIVFMVISISQEDPPVATLKGYDVRLIADAPVSDLQPVSNEKLEEHRHQLALLEEESVRLLRQSRELEAEKMAKKLHEPQHFATFELPGRVLHLDGDEEYLDRCLKMYRQLEVPVTGLYVPEARMKDVVPKLLVERRPDILVLTGHDGYHKRRDKNDLDSYRHSRHFVESVRAARQVERHKDNLVIISGACQSHYEALLGAGANFASSPNRVLIHTYDPVFVAHMVAYTPITHTVDVWETLSKTITGVEGMGGLQTRGTYRVGFPRMVY